LAGCACKLPWLSTLTWLQLVQAMRGVQGASETDCVTALGCRDTGQLQPVSGNIPQHLVHLGPTCSGEWEAHVSLSRRNLWTSTAYNNHDFCCKFLGLSTAGTSTLSPAAGLSCSSCCCLLVAMRFGVSACAITHRCACICYEASLQPMQTTRLSSAPILPMGAQSSSRSAIGTCA
jgi:hypothetical protein